MANAIKAGDKVTISAAWLNVCGKTRAIGATWVVTSVQPMVGDECMYHIVSAKHGIWSVWSIRGVTLVLDAKGKRARKAARKMVQRPFNSDAEDRAYAFRCLDSCAELRRDAYAYRKQGGVAYAYLDMLASARVNLLAAMRESGR